MRAKFEDPLGRAWMEMACTNARHSDRAGVALAPLRASLTAAYQETLNILTVACGTDTARLARYADVQQRMSFVEAHMLPSNESRLVAHRARESRLAHSNKYRESIAGAIGAT